MSAPEKFREAEPLKDERSGMTAHVIRVRSLKNVDRVLCEIGDLRLCVPEARALRDWLTEVLP